MSLYLKPTTAISGYDPPWRTVRESCVGPARNVIHSILYGLYSRVWAYSYSKEGKECQGGREEYAWRNRKRGFMTLTETAVTMVVPLRSPPRVFLRH